MAPQLSLTTHPLAERHEALWLRLSALHKDICAIAANSRRLQWETPSGRRWKA